MEQREVAPSRLNPLREALLCSLFQDCLLPAEVQDHPRSLGKESQREREVGREGREMKKEGEALMRENQPTNITGYVSVGLISPVKNHSFDLCFPGTQS